MKIGEILKCSLVVPELNAREKETVLAEMTEHLCCQCPDLSLDAEWVRDALVRRERLGSTGVGEGVAIPHAKIAGLNSLVACFGRSVAGVSFDAIDHQPVKLLFVLLVPENSAGTHLKALARISRLLKSAAFRERLLELGDQQSLYDAFLEEDAKY